MLVVEAGPNQTISLPNSATLVGTVTADGLVNPPGTVTFGNPSKDRFGVRVMNLSLSASATTPYFVDPINRAAEQAWAAGIVVLQEGRTEGGQVGPEPSRLCGQPGHGRGLGDGALMLQAHPELSPDQVKSRLMVSAMPALSSGELGEDLTYNIFQ